MVRFAFAERGFGRVELHIEPDNAASVRTAMRSGFERTNIRPGALDVGGEVRDLAVFARAEGRRSLA